MTKLKTVAMIGAMLLGSSALALAQTSPTTTSPSTSTTTAPSNTTGATSGSTSSSSTTTAPGPQSAMKSEQDVTKRLRAEGYSDVTGVKQDKNGYTASAMKNGKRVKVEIDADGNIQSMN
jgi:hypothetical protein